MTFYKIGLIYIFDVFVPAFPNMFNYTASIIQLFQSYLFRCPGDDSTCSCFDLNFLNSTKDKLKT